MSGLSEHANGYYKYDPKSRSYLDPLQRNGETIVTKKADPEIIKRLQEIKKASPRKRHGAQYSIRGRGPVTDKQIFEIKREFNVQ